MNSFLYIFILAYIKKGIDDEPTTPTPFKEDIKTSEQRDVLTTF